MNPINPAKLLHSKWTATQPQQKEKHFMVIKVTYDEAGRVEECLLQAVMTQREFAIHWRDLKDPTHWRQGWQ